MDVLFGIMIGASLFLLIVVAVLEKKYGKYRKLMLEHIPKYKLVAYLIPLSFFVIVMLLFGIINPIPENFTSSEIGGFILIACFVYYIVFQIIYLIPNVEGETQ